MISKAKDGGWVIPIIILSGVAAFAISLVHIRTARLERVKYEIYNTVREVTGDRKSYETWKRVYNRPDVSYEDWDILTRPRQLPK